MTTKRKPGRPKGTGKPVTLPERLQTVKLPKGGRKAVADAAKAAALTVAQYVRRALGLEEG